MKTAYARLFECAQVHGESADVSDLGINVSDIDKLYWAFDYDNAQFLALGSGYSYGYKPSNNNATSIKIKYGRSASEIAGIQSEFNATAQKVIADAKKAGSGYNQLKYVHDWIVNNTVYMSSGPLYKSEADGAVVYGKALCEGYSKAFMYFAQSLGYECVCISGYAGESHMWNMVKLDGNWYHVDVTWDDPVTASGENMLRYDYFMISDSTIGKDHKVDNIFAVPTAPRNYN